MKPSIILAAIAAVALSGCMSDAQWKDTRIMHAQYMQQTRTFNSFHAEGSNMTFTISGANKIEMSAPLNPLTTIPQYPDFAKDVLDGAKTVAGYAALGYIGGKAVSRLAEPTVVNTTVAP